MPISAISNTVNTSQTPGSSKDEPLFRPASSLPEDVGTSNKNLRTQADVDKIIQNIIKNYDISLEDAKSILINFGNIAEEDLLTMEVSKFNQIQLCLSNALMDCAKNGKIEIKQLARNFIGYKVSIINRGLTPEQAKEEINKHKNMDLIDFLAVKNPNLQGKDISQISVHELKDALAELIKTQIKLSKLTEMRKKPAMAKEMALDYFTELLNKCEAEEKTKLFEAFALLLKDEELKEVIPDLCKKMVQNIEDPQKAANFVQKIGPEILRSLGFDDTTIGIIQQGLVENMTAEQIGAILDNVISVIEHIDEKDLPIIQKALTNPKNLTEEEIKVYAKYQDIIHSAIVTVAAALDKPNLANQLSEKYKILQKKLEETNLAESFYRNLKTWVCDNPKLFEGMSKAEINKRLNELTDNAYGEATGETVPSEDSNNNGDYGFAPKAPGEAVIQAQNNMKAIMERLLPKMEDDNNEYTVEKSNNNENSARTNDEYSTTTSIAGLTLAEVKNRIKKGYISSTKVIATAIQEYKDLSNSVQQWVEQKINSMSKSAKEYMLQNTKGSTLVALTKKTDINPEELNIRTDYYTKKELERTTQKV